MVFSLIFRISIGWFFGELHLNLQGLKAILTRLNTSSSQRRIHPFGARNSWGAYVVGADPLSDIAVLQVKDEASVRDPAKWHEMKVGSWFVLHWCHVDWVGLGFFVQQIVHVQSLWTNPWAPQIAFYIILPFPFCIWFNFKFASNKAWKHTTVQKSWRIWPLFFFPNA